jgi:hypothetical protein
MFDKNAMLLYPAIIVIRIGLPVVCTGGTPMPADSQQMQVERNDDGQFVKGQSGNPAGRVLGSRNRATLMAEQFLDNQAYGLVQKALQLALDGDRAALRLCLGRVIGPRRQRPSEFALPPLKTAADAAPAMAAIAAAVADGAISSSEGCEFSQIVDSFLRALEAGEVEARLQRLEAVHGIAL